MITSMRGCVAYNDLWPWPISSRSLGLDLENRVLSVASTVLDGFFPYMVQMITSMRRCVAHDDLWPWPISSRSFGLDLENRVLSVASTVLDGFFPYLVQMITSMRRCVACDDLWPWPISSRSFGVDLENRVLSVASTVLDGFFPYLVQMITSMRRCVACDDLWPWPISSRSFDLDFENRVCSVTFSVLDRLFLACSRACASKVFSLRADCGRVIVYPGLKQWERPRHNIFGVCTRLAGGVCMSTSANSSASKHLTVTKIVWKIVYVTFDYLISHFFKILSLEFMANLFRDFRASV